MSHTLPSFPSPDLGTQPLPERINMNDIKKLQTLYRDHCEVGSITLGLLIIIYFSTLERCRPILILYYEHIQLCIILSSSSSKSADICTRCGLKIEMLVRSFCGIRFCKMVRLIG